MTEGLGKEVSDIYPLKEACFDALCSTDAL